MDQEKLTNAVKIVALGQAKRIDLEGNVKIYITGGIIRIDIPQSLVLETVNNGN